MIQSPWNSPVTGWRGNYIRVQLYIASTCTRALRVSFEKNTRRRKPGDAVGGEFIYSIIKDAIARHCNANFQLTGIEMAEMDGGSAKRNITEM